MGDRAIVRFPDGDGGVGVYLHWHGSEVAGWLHEAAPRMRKGDNCYAAARFIGYCHERIEGGLSLGVYPLGMMVDGVQYTVHPDGRVDAPSGKSFTIPMGRF